MRDALLSPRLDPRMFDPTKLEGLVDEIASKNHVRVVKYEARSKQFGPRYHKKVLDELGESSVLCGGLHGIAYADGVRMLAGAKPVYLDEALRLLGGDLRSVTRNLRTTVGADFASAQLGGVSVLVADWIALTNNTGTPVAGDTSATVQWATAQAVDAAGSGTTAEYTVLGVARKNATYAHTGGTALFTQSATWTASGTVTALRIAGLFGGAAKTAQGSGATNILVLENTFTATSLVNLDQLSLTWTVNL
jgi:hypothetical protein